MRASLLGFGGALLAMGACGHSDGGGTVSPQDAAAPAPFSQTLLDDARITSDSSQPTFQKAAADVTLIGGPFASVTLVVDLGSTCFPFSGWSADAPPSGQRWPADCDAFDRNFEMALIDPANPSAPGLELVRAITPFGGPEHVEADVTDVFNFLGAEKRTFVVTIPTYSDAQGLVSGSKGGWNVSAHLEATPGTPPRHVLSVQPLVYDSFDATKSGQTLSFPFTLPSSVTATSIQYRVTGHGGEADSSKDCIGPAEEFCKRTHSLTLDGQPLDTLVPWRKDCSTLCTHVVNDAGAGPTGTYCAENPCGAIASVDAPRANWCPGSVTPPFTYASDLAAGDHTFAFSISSIKGQWRVSATVFSYGD